MMGYGSQDWLATVDIDGMSQKKQLATLLNAYNAFTMHLVAKNFVGNSTSSGNRPPHGASVLCVAAESSSPRCLIMIHAPLVVISRGAAHNKVTHTHTHTHKSAAAA